MHAWEVSSDFRLPNEQIRSYIPYIAFCRRNQDSVITAIEQRLAMASHLPPSHQEDMQVLRYGPTNKYGPHMDGLERVMSVLIYLIGEE